MPHMREMQTLHPKVFGSLLPVELANRNYFRLCDFVQIRTDISDPVVHATSQKNVRSFHEVQAPRTVIHENSETSNTSVALTRMLAISCLALEVLHNRFQLITGQPQAASGQDGSR